MIDDVVVTGLGATTPLGGDVATFWAGLLEGRSGVVALTEDWAADLKVRIAARMAVDPTEVLARVQARRLDRAQQAAVIAAREAWADAGFTGRADEAGLPPGARRGGNRHRHRWRREPDPRARRHPGQGSQPGFPAAHPAGHAQWISGARGAGNRRPRRRSHSGERLRVRRGGRRLWSRFDRAGPGRCGPRRRYRGLRSPAHHLGLRPDAGDEHPQRRAGAGVSPVRQGPGRFRTRAKALERWSSSGAHRLWLAAGSPMPCSPERASPPMPTTWWRPTRTETGSAAPPA